MSLNDDLLLQLSKRKEQGLLRQLKVSESLIDFSSNDYLGLARSHELHELIERRFDDKYPRRNGSGGSRLLSGNTTWHEQVEDKLALLFNSASTTLFNSGYSANLAVVSTLPRKGDTIIYDELAHACIKDGARLSAARRYSFRHNDLEDLRRKIKRSEGRIFVCVESVYSMDGDQCPLADLVALSAETGIHIILDEAHSTGVYGKNGTGLAEELGLSGHIDVRIFTFGKAMGIHGACVAGSTALKSYLINFARPFIYTTAPDFYFLASIEGAFDFLKQRTDLQALLMEKVSRFTNTMNDFKDRTNSESAIQTILFTGNADAVSAANILQRAGFDVRPILSPTVPPGRERLRMTLHVFNTDGEIDALASAVKSLPEKIRGNNR